MKLRDLVHRIHQREVSVLSRTLIRVGLALLFVAAFGATSYGKTLIVGQPGTPCPNAQYTTITDAVNAASPGDVVAICPALYAEQLVISKPLTLRGLTVNGVGRVLLQPSLVPNFGGLSFEAVIAVTNTHDVTIENLAIDASNNTVVGCAGPALAGIHTITLPARRKTTLSPAPRWRTRRPAVCSRPAVLEFKSTSIRPVPSVSRSSTTASMTTRGTEFSSWAQE